MENTNKLSPEQIEIWRKVLFGMVGPLAFLISDENIQEYKNNFQAKFNSLDEPDIDDFLDEPVVEPFIEPDFEPKPMTAMELAFAKVKK